MNDDVVDFLKSNKNKVNKYLFSNLPITHPIPEVQKLYEMMLDYPRRSGKGIRSAQCMLICEALGGDTDKALNTAAILDLLQNWILIHDDIEDGSELRRGEPCLHKKYGIPIAINVGDALHCKMWDLLCKNLEYLGTEMSLKIIEEFTKLSDRVVMGQHIELSWVNDYRWNLTEQDYFTMCEHKTAWYTCITPCRVGAIIANADSEIVDSFISIGRDLGVAFQIQDDILNLIGDEDKYGKEIAGDIAEGKRTLMLIHLLNSCTEMETKEICEIMDKPRNQKKQEDYKRVIDLMKKYDSIKYARSQAISLSQKAKNKFNEVMAEQPETTAKQNFLKLVDFVIERDS